MDLTTAILHKVEPCEIKEINCIFYLRTLTAQELDSLELATLGLTHNIRGETLARTLCTPDGHREYTDSQGIGLGEMPAWLADRLFDVALSVNKLDSTTDQATADTMHRKNITPSGRKADVVGIRGVMETLTGAGLASKVQENGESDAVTPSVASESHG